MPNYTKEQWNTKKEALMEGCYDCFAEYGLHGTSIRILAEHCGCITNKFYTYFTNLDELIVQSTEHCMTKVKDEFMARLPDNLEELWQFIDEMPYWMAEKHGKKYRVMYQVFTHPKYREYGQEFIKGVNERYEEYAKTLEPKLGIPHEKIASLIFTLVRVCVHYALFEDEFYMKSQIEVLKETLELFIMKYNPEASPGAVDK